MELSPDEKMKALAARADLARSRLTTVLGALERRRREVLDVPLQLTKHAKAVGVVGAACVAGIAAYAVYRAATAASRRRGERWRMMQRVWNHPEKAAPPEPTIWGKVAKALVVAAARSLVTKVLAAQMKHAEEERQTPLALPAASVENPS